MKIKDLPENESLRGIRFKYPGYNSGDARMIVMEPGEYYWFSQSPGCVWAKKDMGENSIYTLFCDDLKDALEWEVVQ